MFFRSVDVVVVGADELHRRVLRFSIIECAVVLDEDRDEERQSKRHKYKPVRWWRRMDKRGNNMSRREIPWWVTHKAVQEFREQVQFDETRT